MYRKTRFKIFYYVQYNFIIKLIIFSEINVYYLMDFFKKDDKYVFIVEIRVVCGEFLAFQFPLFLFFKTNQVTLDTSFFRYTLSICISEGR